ncbi:hypothetical protein [Sphingobacterium yanglingense]|nr:hypothetical protein [Sphingobacterium yanglingense]
MANRIETFLNDIARWKDYFENLASKGMFSTANLGSRQHKKELLNRYREIAGTNLKNLTSEEKASMRIVQRERRQLERELYPNVILRFVRNMFRLTNATLGKVFVNPMKQKQSQKTVDAELHQFGLESFSDKIAPQIRAGQNSIVEKTAISKKQNEVLEFGVSVDKDMTGRHYLKEATATLTLNEKDKRSLSFIDNMGLSPDKANNLLAGRPVLMYGDRWKIPNINDTDGKGNIIVKEIKVIDYKIEELLTKIPGTKLSSTELQKTVKALKKGERIEIPIKIDGKQRNIGLEASPLKRDFIYYEGNRRTTLDQLLGQRQNEAKTINLKEKQQQSQRSQLKKKVQ